MVMSIGFELEAGVGNETEARKIARKVNWKTGNDGSISCNSFPIEFRSRVYKIRHDYKKMMNDFRKISECIQHTNSSMGLHIHVSFTKGENYQKLCSYKFVKRFQTSYRQTFKKHLEQLRMSNTYCRFYHGREEFLDKVVAQLECDYHCERYFAVNFNAYPCHGTIEFRIFPSTKSLKKFKSYVNFVIRNVNEGLRMKVPKTMNWQIKENLIRIENKKKRR